MPQLTIQLAMSNLVAACIEEASRVMSAEQQLHPDEDFRKEFI